MILLKGSVHKKNEYNPISKVVWETLSRTRSTNEKLAWEGKDLSRP